MTEHMTDTEAALLASIVQYGNRILEDVHLRVDQFSTPLGQAIYRLAQEMHRDGTVIDQVTLTNHAKNLQPAEAYQVEQRVRHLALAPTTPGAVAEYANEIRRQHTLSTLERLNTRAATQINLGASPDVILMDMQRELANVETTGTHATVHLGEGLQDTLDELKSKPVYTETPWDDLNYYINGWAPGRMYVIGARPGAGKTVAGLQAAIALAKRGPVAYISLEMDPGELRKRMISHIARVDMGRIMRHDLGKHEWEKITETRPDLETVEIHANANQTMTIEDVIQHVREVKRRHGLIGIVVDYLGLIQGNPQQREYETVTEASRRLKLLALELDVPVLALSQLNRGVTGRDDKEPRLSDLRSSGAIEQDADVVILLHREDGEGSEHEVKMIVAKNRQGQRGNAVFEFAGHYSEIRNNPGF